jgi:hypothetical protein
MKGLPLSDMDDDVPGLSPTSDDDSQNMLSPTSPMSIASGLERLSTSPIPRQAATLDRYPLSPQSPVLSTARLESHIAPSLYTNDQDNMSSVSHRLSNQGYARNRPPQNLRLTSRFDTTSVVSGARQSEKRASWLSDDSDRVASRDRSNERRASWMTDDDEKFRDIDNPVADVLEQLIEGSSRTEDETDNFDQEMRRLDRALDDFRKQVHSLTQGGHTFGSSAVRR